MSIIVMQTGLKIAWKEDVAYISSSSDIPFSALSLVSSSWLSLLEETTAAAADDAAAEELPTKVDRLSLWRKSTCCSSSVLVRR